MDSKLYHIEVVDKDQTFGDLMLEHERGLSIAIVEKICYAIDNNMLRVDIAVIDTGKITITLHASIKNYEETLETNIENLIKHEEYELCAQGKKALMKLRESRNYKKYLDI